MTDETYNQSQSASGSPQKSDDSFNGYANRETWAFNLHWSNDQGLYNDTLAAARDYIDGQMQNDPEGEVTDRQLGEYIADHWSAVIDEYEDEAMTDAARMGESSAANSLKTLRMFRREVGSWWRINYAEVGAAVRESLDAES